MSYEDKIRRVEPYIPGEQPKGNGIIKLNTNECPYPPSPLVQQALLTMDADAFRLYPDTDAGILSEALCDTYGIERNQLFVGVGSDDVLSLAFMTFFHSNQPILFPDITYSFYDVWAGLYRIPFQKQPLNDAFCLVKEDYLKPNGGIIIPNPNAPTGILEPVSFFEEIAAHNKDSVVIVDEAYIDFGGSSALPLIKTYDNLLVVQTFSKSRAMAGMRIGYAMGSPKLISYLKNVKFAFNSYTMNMPSMILGEKALQDKAYFKSVTDSICATRERVKKELAKLGFSFPDSMGNFIFATHERVHAKELFEALKKEHIYVRYFNSARIDNHLRITVGTDEEMNVLLRFLKEYLYQ